MTQPRINGTAAEKIEWLRRAVDKSIDERLFLQRIDNGNLVFRQGLGEFGIVLGQNGQWWIEEET